MTLPATKDAGPPALDAAPSPTEPLGVCENRIDYSWDPKDVTTIHARFGYDEAGRLVRYVEVDALGNVGISLRRTFDAAGLRRTQDEYMPRIPPVNRKVTWGYDAAARVTSVLMDTSDVDGGAKRADLTSLSYDAEARLSRTESSSNAGPPQDVVVYRYLEGEPRIVEEAHDLLGDGTVDWTWRYGFGAGKWLVFVESTKGATLQAKEIYTYGDLSKGELAERDFDTDGDGKVDYVDRFTWSAGQVVHVEYDGEPDGTQNYALEYDGQGRLVKKTWLLPKFTWVTKITYGPSGLLRVERRDVPTGVLIERWDFTYGCPAGYPMEIRIAPVIDWQRETSILPYNLDGTTYWGFPEAL